MLTFSTPMTWPMLLRIRRSTMLAGILFSSSIRSSMYSSPVRLRESASSVASSSPMSAYKNLPSRGFTHKPDAVSQGSDPAHVVLPAVHRVASLLKRWLLGTHHGGIGAQHVEAYLDEFIFRFNRRQSNARGLLFYRLIQNAVVVKKLDYDTIVWSRRGQAGKIRGPKRKTRTTQRRTSGASSSSAP